MAGFERTLSPIDIGPIRIPNRVARAAHGTGLGRAGIGDEFIAYHRARARGGCGLTILEAASVHGSSRTHLSIRDDGAIDGYTRLADAIRPTGMKLFQQLWHGGNLYPGFGEIPLTVSDISGHYGIVGRPATKGEIDDLVDAYSAATRRARAAGLDGVELHAAHGYLPAQFLSPVYNDRSDDYGGSFENRMRFIVETLAAMRAAADGEIAVGIRVSPGGAPGGVDAAMLREVVAALDARGLIDYVNVSLGDYDDVEATIGGMHYPVAYEVSETAPIGRAAQVPSILTGRFRTLEEVEQTLRAGDADLVSMVRAQIADPDLVRKSREGRIQDVRPCIACNQGCLGGIIREGRLGCTVNPGIDVTPPAPPAAQRRRALIVGGGPAGMEAARVAAEAGHDVILAEAGSRLGGMAAIATKAPWLHTMGDILFWLERELDRLQVDVRLNTYLDADDIVAESPDAVIVASGSLPRLDGIAPMHAWAAVPGADQSHVVSASDLIGGAVRDPGRTALVVDWTGHYESIAAIDWLIERKVAVSYLTHLPSAWPAVQPTWRDIAALRRFHAAGNRTVLTRHELVEIRAGECLVRPIQAPATQTQTLAADTVVLVSPNRPNRDLFDALRGKVETIRLIGDALSPRDLQAAIADGRTAGSF